MTRFTLALSLLLLFHLFSNEATAQTAVDSTAVKNTALNYIEGWFEGDPDRMAKALHPELVKRIVVTDDSTGRDMIDGMGITKLVEGTRRGYGRHLPKSELLTDVTILDITGDAASVKIDAGLWVDYLHVVRFNSEWKILNVLWERK
ncbi:MAG: nuclear transport factor 2 family protein [Balneolaceae bacterium]|nr:nuclear transport factor 2 family protein [Balneolaceae bacterium]